VVDAAALTAWVREFARLVHEQRDTLTQLDAAIGDADHGANLDRGMTAVVAALESRPADDPAAVWEHSRVIHRTGAATARCPGRCRRSR